MKFIKLFKKLLFSFFIILGIICFLYVILAFTSIPYYTCYYQGLKYYNDTIIPNYIIMMGAGGMPEENNLIREYYSVLLLNKYTESKLIIALPGNIEDTNSSISLLYKDFIQRGISPNRIIIENKGVNTRTQALKILEIIKKEELNHNNVYLYIVTSPEHVPRAVLSFRKAGLKNSYGYAAFSIDLESNLIFGKKETGGKNVLTNSIGKNIEIRYRFWTYLKTEISLTREFFAKLYYKINGWI